MTQSIEGSLVEVGGDGPAVVLVHGLGMNHRMWDWQWETLTAQFRVLRYDLLGHGESPKPAGPYYMKQMVEQLTTLMSGANMERAALVGFSLGGLIVQAFTLAHPGRVTALAILNAAHDRTPEQRAAVMVRVEQAAAGGPQTTVGAALTRWFSESFAAENPETLARVKDWIEANDPQVYPALYRLLAEADEPLAQAISEISCPTLVVTGEEDFGNSPEMARNMAALIPGATCEILPGLRHMGLAEDPAALHRVLLPFLQANA
ncbi:MAG: alpha/beta fold hydrolase [Pseudomonadota bacterium]